MDWTTLIITLATGGIIYDVASHIFLRHRRRINNAEAEKRVSEAKDAEVSRLLNQIDHQQGTIDRLMAQNENFSQRLATANADINDHLGRNRELSNRIFDSEQTANRLNEQIKALHRENKILEIRARTYADWHCRRNDCLDPRGRQPENPDLEGKVFHEPPEASGLK